MKAAILCFPDSALNKINLLDLHVNGNSITAVLYLAAHSKWFASRKSKKQLRDVHAGIPVWNVDTVGRVEGASKARLGQAIKGADDFSALTALILGDLSEVEVISLRSPTRVRRSCARSIEDLGANFQTGRFRIWR